jgi:glycosyltransferase involved in cell wall biosynthesis
MSGMYPPSESRYTFTVFTPTFNRANTLQRVYDGLEAQTFDDFEWLIVDDGSTDHTRSLVEGWQSISNFSIRYYWQAHQGKAAATNYGVAEARGKLFLTLDSDDACVPRALERLNFHWHDIPAKQREEFSAVTTLCMNPDGRLIGDKFPFDPTDSDSLEIRYKYRVRGEKWGFHRTDVLRAFPFPVSMHGHIPEGVVWRRIAREYKTRFVNEPLRIYWRDGEEGEHLSLGNDYRRVAHGLVLDAEDQLNRDLGWVRHAPLEFIRVSCQYSRFSFHAGISLRSQANALNTLRAKLLWLTGLPLGMGLYWMDSTGTTHTIKRKVQLADRRRS